MKAKKDERRTREGREKDCKRAEGEGEERKETGMPAARGKKRSDGKDETKGKEKFKGGN